MADQSILGPSNQRRGNLNNSLFSDIQKFRLHTRSSLCFLIIYFILTTITASSPKICKDCDQGRCTNGTCVCLPGWKGPHCDQCYGRVRLQPGSQGIIHDGANNYSKDLACSWLLDAGQHNLRVQFEINSFATECSWDHLYVHNGDSVFAPLVAAFSGIMRKSTVKPRLKFRLSGRYIFIHFYSDAAFVLPGFNISYILDDCALECSENGVCNNSVCECEPDWTGDNCDVLVEKSGCFSNCSLHGKCLQGKCQCESGFKGQYCEVSPGELYVKPVAVQGSQSPKGRASASLVYDGMESLWLFGGYEMGNQRLDNLYKFDLANETWIREVESDPTPWPRYGHTVVFYQGKFYLFGGVSGAERKADLWSFEIAINQWSELQQGPRDLSGHTAHVVNGSMVVIFGYSSNYSYSNRILEYNFGSGKWTIVKTTGAVVCGAYGHSSVYDTQAGKIYVYGGYHSRDQNAYNLTDVLYQYDPVAKEWFILTNSRSARYLHAAAMINSLMITFGGSTNNDTQQERKAKCFASDFMVFDRVCNSWHTLSPAISGYYDHLDRVGHNMVSVNNEIYMFGGFNSIVKNGMYKISAGSCSYFKDEEACNDILPGIKCVWSSGGCEEFQNGRDSCANDDRNAPCVGYNTCHSCLGNSSCHWCDNGCVSSQDITANCSSNVDSCTNSTAEKYCSVLKSCSSCEKEDVCLWRKSDGTCKALQSKPCSDYMTCTECGKARGCGWCFNDISKKGGRCVESSTSKPSSPLGTSCVPQRWYNDVCPEEDICPKQTCSAQTSCENCTQHDCMWCSNLNKCIATNSYVVSFHYAQCMDWTTKQSTCKESVCFRHKDCEACQAVPKCGWCSDKTNTGTGTCHEGGMLGPVSRVTTKNSGYERNNTVCPADRWYFNDCPKCQCNGHSTCINDTSTCKSCQFPTTGSQCQFCASGWYGLPKHGGTCKECSCNGQADLCNHETGVCFCLTRGVIGDACESCDDKNMYHGDPRNGGSCYYRLQTDFQYTFNLTKPEDQNYTKINFRNTPKASDRDVDFTLNCSTTAFINITYKSKSFPGETEYVSGRLCDYFRSKFEHKKHAFGGKENTTFMVYVYDFKTPFMLQISFVQQEKINLYKFFIIFFSCFLALILLVAAAWKIKHKIDSYRRGRRLEVEMQQMARRPFSTIAVEIEKKSKPVVVDRKDHVDSVLRRRKKQMGSKPSSIAIEPLKDNKAAILSLLIQLPTGHSDYAPSGHSGLAVGSALVSVGSNRKQSLEHVKGDRSKIRKTLNYNHPDACA